MEYQLTGVSRITMSHTKGSKSSQLQETDFYLDVSDNLDQDSYLDEDGLPNAGGCQALTAAFTMGLIGNVHAAHQKGYRDSAEHLRYIISKLEEAFVSVAEVTKGTF